MVLNEIIEQAGRQSRASDQNGTTTHTIHAVAYGTTLSLRILTLFYQRSMFLYLLLKTYSLKKNLNTQTLTDHTLPVFAHYATKKHNWQKETI